MTKRTEDTSSEWSPSLSRRDCVSRLDRDPQTTRDHDLPTRHEGTRLDREFVAADPGDDAAPTDPAATATAPGADHGPGRTDPTIEWGRARGSASRGTAGCVERSTSPSLSFSTRSLPRIYSYFFVSSQGELPILSAVPVLACSPCRAILFISVLSENRAIQTRPFFIFFWRDFSDCLLVEEKLFSRTHEGKKGT